MSLPKHTLITGASGTLGSKLSQYLRGQSELTLLDQVETPGVIVADLSRWDEKWVSHFKGVDAVVHFAGNPIAFDEWDALLEPNVDAVLNVFEAAARNGVRRVVFASSNHVMGGYRDISEAQITEELTPRPGVQYFANGEERNSAVYGATKLFGERIGKHFAEVRGLEVLSVRIGWVWKGKNLPGELPSERGDWFRNMWLSDRDFLHLMERCLISTLPARHMIVNGMSSNSGMRWDLSVALNLLGYAPQDDVHAERSNNDSADE